MPDTRFKVRHCSICLVCTSDVTCVRMDESMCSVGKIKLVEASRASRVSSPGYPQSHTTSHQIDNCGRVHVEAPLYAFFGRFETAKNKLAIWGIKFRDRWPKNIGGQLRASGFLSILREHAKTQNRNKYLLGLVESRRDARPAALP